MKNLRSLFSVFAMIVVLALSTGCSFLIPHQGSYNEEVVNGVGMKSTTICSQNELGGNRVCRKRVEVDPAMAQYGYGMMPGVPMQNGTMPAFNPPKVDCFVNDRGQKCCMPSSGVSTVCYGSEGDAFDPMGSPNMALQSRVDSIGRQVNNLNEHARSQDACIKSGNCVKKSKKR